MKFTSIPQSGCGRMHAAIDTPSCMFSLKQRSNTSPYLSGVAGNDSLIGGGRDSLVSELNDDNGGLAAWKNEQ